MPSVVEAVAAGLRERILAGDLPAGVRLTEAELCAAHGAARHSVRTALRVLADEGLVRLEANRGARVSAMDPRAVVPLYELRTALEVEAAHLALLRHGGRLPARVHEAADRLAGACRRPETRWPEVSAAHGEVHASIVRAARSPRIEAAHRRLEAETRLFLLHVRPHWTLEELARDHLALVDGLERDGPDVLRRHLRASASALTDEASLLQ